MRAGQAFEYDVGVTGEPPPKKVWTLGGNTITSMGDLRVKLVTEDYSIKLKVSDAKRQDSGEYTLTATNINGRDQATVKVTVLDVPSAPEGPLQVNDMNKSSCVLRWRPPKDDGGSDITHYIVEKQDAENMRWIPVADCKGSNFFKLPEKSRNILKILKNHQKSRKFLKDPERS